MCLCTVYWNTGGTFDNVNMYIKVPQIVFNPAEFSSKPDQTHL